MKKIKLGMEKHWGWGVVLALTAWMFTLTQPLLWLKPTWPNGGDIASHLLYVGLFKTWFLEQGKISGWMPEVFAGFPALTYYFPFPFILIVLGSLAIGLKLAFKFVVMLPAFFLPAAVCWSTGMMGWPWPARLLGATATVGFLVNEASSIWGGNILAQFSGEFAYSWGMLMAVVFFGCLDRLLRRGGLGWFLAAVLVEVVTALSHGFAILVVGFGSFLYLLLSGGGWRALWLLLRLHLLSFLLLGFWLIPLLANHIWTIPNDTIYAPSRWLRTFWPSNFWWVLCGLPALVAFLFRERLVRLAWMPFLAMSLIGLVGALLAPQLGLANVRFLPYAQLGFTTLLAGALGWWLHDGCRLPFIKKRSAPLSHRYHRLALTLAVFLTLGLVNHWNRIIVSIPAWSYTFFTGYEGRSQWTVYRRLADHLQGGLDAPRILFEHHPGNHDLGSTRTLEALPFFGSRPVLEGLYMESAISAPFIYQLQYEVSQHPSAPLSRYPPRRGTVTTAFDHMRALSVDTLLLRSPRMKQKFSEDARFQKDAEIGPFLILRLAEGTSPLVELLTLPLQTKGREGWLDRAYNRFLMDHPYQVRQVFVEAGVSLPKPSSHCQGGTARLERMERERLVILTDRPGCPHLIRMSYHPKWRALTGEQVHLVEPFFMLIFPKGERLVLGYLPDGANRLGWFLTLLGGIFLLFLWAGRKVTFPGFFLFSIGNISQDASDAMRSPRYRMILGLMGVGLVAVLGWQSSPESAYQSARSFFNQQRYEKAATLFDQSVRQRRGWARHAESLFWAGLAWERAGHPDEGARRYQHLVDTYPAGHFAPEALYRLFLRFHQNGEKTEADALLARLAVRYPTSRWLKRGQEASARP